MTTHLSQLLDAIDELDSSMMRDDSSQDCFDALERMRNIVLGMERFYKSESPREEAFWSQEELDF